MAKFEGVKWAPRQMSYRLAQKQFAILDADAKVFAVSRSVHYGLFLVFEGIRFFCQKSQSGEIEVIFLNWHRNLERFQKGIAFNLSADQQNLVPTVEERPFTYGELLERVKKKDLIVACSVGTAGILNRCHKLSLIDDKERIVATHYPDENHPLYEKFREAREYYWNIYKEKAKVPAGLKLFKYIL